MPNQYSTGVQAIDDIIRALIRLKGHAVAEDHIADIITTALKLVDEGASTSDSKIASNALKEMRYSYKVFSGYRGVRKVTIFGSARTQANHPNYKLARDVSRRLRKAGFMLISGAGPGIMEAGLAGAGREYSFGVNIRLPFEQKASSIIDGDPKLINYKYFFIRKLFFVRETDAVVIFPGGFGTLDEMFELLTLAQTGKCHPLPIVLCDYPQGTYWKSMVRLLKKEFLGNGTISKEDFNLFRVTDNPAEACQEVLHFFRNYHSSRYVRGRLVIRVRRPVTPSLLEKLNDRYRSLITEGRIEASEAHPDESDEPELAALPRISFKFNRFGFGSLRCLINDLNDVPGGARRHDPGLGRMDLDPFEEEEPNPAEGIVRDMGASSPLGPDARAPVVPLSTPEEAEVPERRERSKTSRARKRSTKSTSGRKTTRTTKRPRRKSK